MPCIKKGDLLHKEKVELPELGPDAYAYVRALSARDVLGLRDQFGEADNADHLPFAAAFVARAAVGDDGERLFDSGDDVLAHFGASPDMLAALRKLAEASIRVSGIEGSDPEKNSRRQRNSPTTSAFTPDTPTPTDSSPNSRPANGSAGNGSPPSGVSESTGTIFTGG